MKKKFVSVFCLLLALVTFLSVPASAASAATPSVSNSKYIQTYTLAASGKIYAYTDSSLKTKKGNNWYIDCPTDECRIVKITSTAVQVSYPIGNGKWVSQPQWFRRSDFTKTDISKGQTVKVTTAKITTYRKNDGKTTYGYTGSGDQIYVLGTTGKYTQIIYELSNGNWKMGWIKSADASKYLKDPAVKKSNDSITITNAAPTYSAKEQTYRMTANVKSGTRITYSSNNSKIKITSAGFFTVPAKFTGSFTITLKSAGNNQYNSATTSKTYKITSPSSNSSSKSTTSVNTSSDQAILTKSLEFFKLPDYKEGSYWGSYTPNGNKGTKLSNFRAWQCCAYVHDYAKYMYGKDYVESEYKSKYTDISKVRAGDILHVNSWAYEACKDSKGNVIKDEKGNPKMHWVQYGDKAHHHWIVVIAVNGNKYDVLEANVGGGVAKRRTYVLWYDNTHKAYALRWDYTSNGWSGGCNNYTLYQGYSFR